MITLDPGRWEEDPEPVPPTAEHGHWVGETITCGIHRCGHRFVLEACDAPRIYAPLHLLDIARGTMEITVLCSTCNLATAYTLPLTGSKKV